MRRWWPYALVAMAFWILPAIVLIVGYTVLPDYIASGQCEGLGGGCTLTPKDGTVLIAIVIYPWVLAAGLALEAVILGVRVLRNRATRVRSVDAEAR